MKKLTVDRIDSVYAICIDAEKKFFAISLTELPAPVAAGDKLEISDEGEITILPR